MAQAALKLDELFDVSSEGPWRPQVGPQLDAIQAKTITEMLYGGAAGGGKTDFLLGDFLQDVPIYGAAWRGILFRKTMGELEDIIARAHELYPQTGAFYNETKAIWRWPNGASLRFRYLEIEKHKYRYQGHAYCWVAFDELTHWATDSAYRYLRGRLRSRHDVPLKRMRSTANPGGVGHAWVKAKFISHAPGGYTVMTDPDTKGTVLFMPAKLSDNRILLRNDPNYAGRLRGLGSEALVKAMLDGDWDVIEGAYFDCWSSKQHVIKPFKVPPEWVRFRSGDWGSYSPFSVGWWAVVQDDHMLEDGRILPRGALVRYREWYGTRDPAVAGRGLKLTAGAVGRGIASLEEGEKLVGGVLDPSAFKADGGPSIAENINKELIAKKLVPFRPADNTRVLSQNSKDKRGPMSGWDQMRARLVGTARVDETGAVDWTTGAPMIYCFSTCVASIRTIPVLQHDPAKPEDLDTNSEDHCFAAGTLVCTDNGMLPIEALPTAGRVMSSAGQYEPYRSARLVQRAAQVVRLGFENGVSIVCTLDHRFLVDTDEWRYAKDLFGESVLCSPLWLAERSRSLMARGTTCAENTFSAEVSACMSLFGSIITGPFLQAITSIIRKPEPITVSMTSNVSLSPPTLAAVTDRRAASARKNSWESRASLQQSGTEVQKARRGTLSTSISIFDRHWSGAFLRYVSSVARAIWSPPVKSRKGSSAETTARRVRCVSVEPLSERRDVYCLTVPSTGCFAIEGGILVSNCSDEWRYACSSRPWMRTQEIAEPPPDGYKSASDQLDGAEFSIGVI